MDADPHAQSRAPALAELDGGSHSDFAWAEDPLHDKILSVGKTLQLQNLN